MKQIQMNKIQMNKIKNKIKNKIINKIMNNYKMKKSNNEKKVNYKHNIINYK